MNHEIEDSIQIDAIHVLMSEKEKRLEYRRTREWGLMLVKSVRM